MPYTRPDDQPAIIRVTPPEERLRLHYRPDLLRQGGVGGWIERPHDRNVSTVEWVGTPSHSWTLRLFFDRDVRYSRPNTNGDIEADLDRLHRFGQPTEPGQPPPVLRLNFGHGQQLRLVITDIIYRSTDLDPTTKRRARAEVDVILIEHRQAELAFSPVEAVEAEAAAPAESDQAASGGYVRPGSARSYTVRSGDTLSAIAASELGNASRWPDIFDLNNPDPINLGPDLLLPGWVLTLPAA